MQWRRWKLWKIKIKLIKIRVIAHSNRSSIYAIFQHVKNFKIFKQIKIKEIYLAFLKHFKNFKQITNFMKANLKIKEFSKKDGSADSEFKRSELAPSRQFTNILKYLTFIWRCIPNIPVDCSNKKLISTENYYRYENKHQGLFYIGLINLSNEFWRNLKHIMIYILLK